MNAVSAVPQTNTTVHSLLPRCYLPMESRTLKMNGKSDVEENSGLDSRSSDKLRCLQDIQPLLLVKVCTCQDCLTINAICWTLDSILPRLGFARNSQNSYSKVFTAISVSRKITWNFVRQLAILQLSPCTTKCLFACKRFRWWDFLWI